MSDITLRRRAGFTLVELLVVIGIIALLISILLPSLARARQAAINLQCQANLRTIGQGLALYISENRGVYPHGWARQAYNSLTGAYDADLTWSQTVANTLTGAILHSRQGARSHDGTGMLVCPARPVPPEMPWTERTTYSSHPIVFHQVWYNTRLWGDGNGSFGFANNVAGTGVVAPLYRASWMTDASEKVIVWDGAQMFNGSEIGRVRPVGGHIDGDRFFGQSLLVTNQGLWQPHLRGTNVLDQPANVDWTHFDIPDNGSRDYYRFRHMSNDTGNFLFADGHVESFKRSGTQAGATSGLLRRNTHVNYSWPGAGGFKLQ